MQESREPLVFQATREGISKFFSEIIGFLSEGSACGIQLGNKKKIYLGIPMTFTQERENIIVKMFAAAMRGKFSRLATKYGQETVFQVWVEYVRKGREKAHLLENRWHPDMSLAQALEILDEYSHSIEQLIRNRLEEERKKQE